MVPKDVLRRPSQSSCLFIVMINVIGIDITNDVIIKGQTKLYYIIL